MANNVDVTPGTGATFKTTDTAGVHTGHVNVDSSALPTGAATAAKQPALGTAGTASTDVITVQGIASGTVLPVSGTVTANAGTGTMAVSGPVTDAELRATPLPVSGTVTAELSVADNAVLDAIEAGIDEVTAEIAAGTIDSGTVAARSPDVLSVMPAVISTKAVVSGATSGDNTVVAAQGAGNSICVHSLFLIAAGAVAVRFESAAGGTALTGVMSLAANGGFVLPYNPDGWFETVDNELLNMELGGAVQVSGGITYSVR